MRAEESSRVESAPTDLLPAEPGKTESDAAAHQVNSIETTLLTERDTEAAFPERTGVHEREEAGGTAPKYDDTYRIIKLLGQGGMSAVYLAEHKIWKNRWALKIVKKQQNAFDMLAEPNLLKQLSHPMLPHIVDIFEDEEQICIAEDYISGEDLWHYLVRNGPVSEELAIEWLKQLCDVLNYLHTREPGPIIYRDLKPANIMLREDGSLCLIDFGIARRYNPESGSDTVHAWTMGYAAPEQMSMTGQTDARADIYSLGATMFQLLAGTEAQYLPGMFPRIRTLRNDLSPAMDEILDKCLRPFREERYSSVRELIADLDQFENGKNEKKKRTGAGRFLIPAALALIAAAGVFGATRVLPAHLNSDIGKGTEQTPEIDIEDGQPQEADSSGPGLIQTGSRESGQSQEDDTDRTEHVTAGLEYRLLQMDKANREKYDTLLIELYNAFEKEDYVNVAEILEGEENSELFAQLCSELETGNRYLLFDDFGTENVLAVYRYGLLYYGGWKEEKREGNGIWYALGDVEELRFEGEWADGLPQGIGTVVISARKKPEEWGDLYPVRQERAGTFSEGYYDGEFQINWEMSDGSARNYTPVHYDLGISEPYAADEIAGFLMDFGYGESQAQELADSHLSDENSPDKKTIAICKDSEGRIFTMVEYLENGVDPVNTVFGINMR